MNFYLESVFINRYVVEAKRQRYLGFVDNPKHRKKFLEMLYHGQDLDKKKFKRISGTLRLRQLIGTLDNSACYIISVDPALDGHEMPTETALNQIGGYTEGTVLIFGNCEAIYYCGEAPHNQYLIFKEGY